jgi:hypothetical protein
MITVAGWSARAMLQDASSKPRPRPERSKTVRPGIREARYIAVSVFPVPGGP